MTDAQLVLLCAASQREDGGLAPNLGCSASRPQPIAAVMKGDGMAAASGARFLCQRGRQEARSQVDVRTKQRRPRRLRSGLQAVHP